MSGTRCEKELLTLKGLQDDVINPDRNMQRLAYTNVPGVVSAHISDMKRLKVKQYIGERESHLRRMEGHQDARTVKTASGKSRAASCESARSVSEIRELARVTVS